jgi:hypothetical protein
MINWQIWQINKLIQSLNAIRAIRLFLKVKLALVIFAFVG